MAASRVLETNKRDIIIRGSFFPLVVSLSLFLRIFIYLFILLTSMFCRNFSLKRARIESIKRVREMILGGGIEERKVGVRVPFASPGIIPGRVKKNRSDWCAFLDPVLDGMDFSTSIFGIQEHHCNELDRVCSLLILRSIDIF